jgi:hypothetical protein
MFCSSVSPTWRITSPHTSLSTKHRPQCCLTLTGSADSFSGRMRPAGRWELVAQHARFHPSPCPPYHELWLPCRFVLHCRIDACRVGCNRGQDKNNWKQALKTVAVMAGQPHMWPCQERVWSQEHTGVGITGTATDKDVLQIQTVTVQTDGGSCPATGIILCEEGRTRFATAIRERRRKLETTEWCVGWSGPRLPMTP